MARVLVTGANGFLGRHCLTALTKAGHEPVPLTRATADLLDPAARQSALDAAQAETCIHFAWHADPRDRWHTPANLDWLTASVALAREFAASGGKRMVFVGSCAEYDWSEAVLHEDTPLRPATLYGAAKAATGMALSAAAPALGLSIAWPRVFFCLGPGEPAGRLVPDLIAGLSAGRTVPCTDGEQRRDFLPAAEVARAIACVATSGHTGPINIASGHATPVRDVIAEVARQLGHPELVQLGAIARPANDPPLLVADVTRLRDLGFTPRQDLATAIREAIASRD